MKKNPTHVDLSQCKKGDVLLGRNGIRYIFSGAQKTGKYRYVCNKYQSEVPYNYTRNGTWCGAVGFSCFDIVAVIDEEYPVKLPPVAFSNAMNIIYKNWELNGWEQSNEWMLYNAGKADACDIIQDFAKQMFDDSKKKSRKN